MIKGNPNVFGTYLQTIQRTAVASSAALGEKTGSPDEVSARVQDPLLRVAVALRNGNGPQTFPALCRAADMNPSELLELLRNMEFLGLIVREGTNEARTFVLTETGKELLTAAPAAPQG